MTAADHSLTRHYEALRQLSQSRGWQDGDLATLLSDIVLQASELLAVERVSIWLLDEDRSRLRCAALQDPVAAPGAESAVYERADSPRYFAALDKARTIVVDELHCDGPVQGIFEEVVEPFGFSALLDAPIHLDGACVGAVCHEHRGGARTWSPAEVLFASTMADYAAMALQADRNRKNRERIESQRREMELAAEAAQLATWWWDVTADTSEWSPRMGLLYGVEAGWQPVDTASFLALVHPGDRDRMMDELQAALTGRGRQFRQLFRTAARDGESRWLESLGVIERDEAGAPTFMRGAVMDVTERKVLEERLLQAHKMQAVGRLAGGIAHDFNNLLTVISGAAEMVRADADPGSMLSQDMEEILTASQRAGALTGQLLGIARRQRSLIRAVDLNEHLDQMQSSLHGLVGDAVEVAFALPTETLVVKIDPGQLEAVLVHLLANARDAMPNGGRLTISAQRVSRGGAEYAELVVADDGQGMNQQVLERAIEPFFTTKGRHERSGLGLASSYGVIRQAGGDMHLSSSPGQGTRVEILLPVDDEAPTPAPKEKASSDPSLSPVGTERVLLVEDEPLLRQRAARALRSFGYTVDEAENAGAARALVKDRPAYDLVVTDVVMPPGESGALLGPALIEAGATKAVLLMSGYDFEQLTSDLPAGVHFVAKPFRLDAFGRAVRRILDELKP